MRLRIIRNSGVIGLGVAIMPAPPLVPGDPRMTTGSNPDHPTPLPTARGQTGRSAGLAVALAMSMPAVALAQSRADPPVTGQAAPAKLGFMTDFWTRDTLF